MTNAVTFPGSLIENMRNIGAIVWSPAELFDKLRDNPQCLLPLLVVALGGTLLELETQPLIEQVLVRTAPTDLSMDQLERGMTLFRRAHFVGMLASPIILFIKWAITACLLFLSSTIIGGSGSYRQTLSLVSFSSVILLLESWYSRIVVHLRGLDVLTSPRDLDPPIGLSLLRPDLGPGWFAFLNDFNPFEVWFVFLLVLGLTRLEGFSKKGATLAVVPIWLLLTGLRAGLAGLAGSQY